MRRLWAPILVLVLALALSACGGSKGITATAQFTDVGDLANQAPVMMADVRVGNVTKIELHGYQAMVTMSLDPTARIPKDVIARIRRTSLLGEKIVDLLPPENLPQNAPLLQDGDRIQKTEVRPDLEDLVQSGNSLLAPIAASEVATLVDEGAKGFGGHGGDLRALLDHFRTIVGAYSTRTDEIESVISSLNQLNGTLAPHMNEQAQSLHNSVRALSMLNQEAGQLKKAIVALNRLSIGGRGILDAHSDEMARFFAQMRTILGVLQGEQSSIKGLLKYAPRHNRNTQLVNYQEFNQVLQDFVICGFNNDQSDPARRCVGPGSQ